MSADRRTIEITVSPAGEAVVQTKGFAGPSCRAASRFVERALGDAVAEQLTAEFHQQQQPQGQAAAQQQATQQP
jgi:hypothetical protein